jgi:hypothetical protein
MKVKMVYFCRLVLAFLGKQYFQISEIHPILKFLWLRENGFG